MTKKQETPNKATDEQESLEQEILKQAGLEPQEPPKEPTQTGNAEQPIEVPDVEGTPPEEPESDVKHSETKPEDVVEPQEPPKEDFYIATHTIKVNGTFYNAGDRVPKV